MEETREFRVGARLVDGDGHLWRVVRVAPGTVTLAGRATEQDFAADRHSTSPRNATEGGTTMAAATKTKVRVPGDAKGRSITKRVASESVPTGKKCSGCGKRKPWGSFARNSAHRDNHQSDCKPCKQAREAGYRAAKKAA